MIELPTATFQCPLASGVFNVRLGFDQARWEDYIGSVMT